MTALPTNRIEDILLGCDGVTPGPWHVLGANYPSSGTNDGHSIPLASGYEGEMDPLDAAHIARLDPQTVSSLATELLALRDQNARLAAESDSKSRDWFRFCEDISVTADTHEAVADAVNRRSLDEPDAELLALRKRVALLEPAVIAAQSALAEYIVPDSGISEHDCVNSLLGILDDQDFVRELRALPTPKEPS